MGKFAMPVIGRLFLATIAATALIHGASAACLAPDKQMSPQAVSDFLNNPATLLSGSDDANFDGLSVSIQNLVASNPAALPLVVGLLKNASVSQQKAIGAGLGNAANLCNVPDPKFATEIADALAKATSDPAQIQFALITGKATGSVAGGGGGGVSSGGVGGSTNPVTTGSSGTPTGTPFTSSGTPTIGNQYFSSPSVSSISVASTTASSSVSQ
jgi:hypothetical protein